MLRWITVVPGASLALIVTAAGAPPQAPRPLRLADYYEQVQVGRVLLVPGGDTAVFERRRIDRGADAWISSLVRVQLATGKTRVLVAGAAEPRVSPDGHWLAFLRAGQVWILPLRGGDPWQVTSTPEPVAGYDWGPDSRRVVISTRDPVAAAPGILPSLRDGSDAHAPLVSDAGPPDPGAWTAADPAGTTATAVGSGAGEASDNVSPTAPQPAVASEAEPQGVWLPPATDVAPHRLLPRVITELPFKADGVGYLGPRRHHLYIVDADLSGRSAPGVSFRSGDVAGPCAGRTVESEQMYAQLRRRMLGGGPATGLILYPAQSHAGYPPSLDLDVLRRFGAWFDRYLKEDPDADPFFGIDAW